MSDAVTGTAAVAAPEWLVSLVREIPDFPQPGVVFRDITPLLGDPVAFKRCVDELADRFVDDRVDTVVGVESRGFILGGAIAYRLGAAFVPVRKAGKLPWAVVREEYDNEYARDKLEIHRDAIHPDARVLVVDDVLATGGTAAAAASILERLGAEVTAVTFLLELGFLPGRERLPGRTVRALLTT